MNCQHKNDNNILHLRVFIHSHTLVLHRLHIYTNINIYLSIYTSYRMISHIHINYNQSSPAFKLNM